MKKCSHCKKDKNEADFCRNSKIIDGLNYICRDCVKEKNRKGYLKHIEKRKKQASEYWLKNKEKKSEYIKKWRVNNQEKVREWERKRDKKVLSTPTGRLNGTMKTSIRVCLKGNKKWNKWESLVGYTAEQLKKHIEKQFQKEMTWENYGAYWEIDHIIPKAVFNFTSASDIDFKKCWSLKNLQPLPVKINRSKKDALDKPFQPSLTIS